MNLRFLPLLLSGCVSEATQLIVEIDTDFTVPDELSFVDVDLEESGSRAGFDVSSPEDFPLSFGVVPEGRDASRTIELVVRGLDREDGRALIEQSAVTGFIAHRALRLPIRLDRSCGPVFQTCSAEQTCRAGACEDEAVPVDSLSFVDEEP